jgi:branched-chain amino acid transport system substrate-binding protein
VHDARTGRAAQARHFITPSQATEKIAIRLFFDSRMILNRFTRLLVHGAAASLLFISLSAAAAGNAIVIGQAVDLSGPNGSIGRDYVAGIKTYFDMLNSSGGIDGRRIQYVARDDHGDARLSADAATELIERDQADYLIGGVGDDATKAVLNAPAFTRSGLTLFAPLAAADYASSARGLFWRPGYQQEIRHIFSHFGKLGINDVGIVYQDTPLNADAFRSLAAEIRERKMKPGATARIGANGEDVARAAQQLAAARPGFVLVIADTIGTAQFLKAYRKLDGQTFVAGTSLINLATLRELAGAKAVEWTVFSQVVPNPNAALSPLQIEHLNMMRKYRDEPVSALTLEGFAAAKALAQAIRQTKAGTHAQLKEFFAKNSAIDLGGLSVAAANNGNRLSNYVDIALFRKGSGLLF